MNVKLRVHVVFFDVHDTLIYTRLRPAEIFTQLCQEAEVRIPLKDVEEAYSMSQMLDEQRSLYKGHEDGFWLLFNLEILKQLQIPDPNQRLAQHLMEGFKDVRWWDVYSDAKPVLSNLRREGYRLGVIANARRLVEGRLAHLELTSYFQAITYSEEVGFEKPNPQIFRTALQRMKCRAEEAAHIGDRLVEDVQGAEAVGIHPILLDRKDLYPHVDCDRVLDLREIPHRLRVFPSPR